MRRRLVHPKLALCVVITLCSLWFISILKREYFSGPSEYSQPLIDAVQQKPIYAHSKDKQDLLFSAKDSKTEEKKHAKPLSRIEVYLKERINKIKQSCRDVCKTDQNFLINGMFFFAMSMFSI